MRLVTTMMTKKELSDGDVYKAIEILLSTFNNKYQIFKYNYDNSKYHETDIDLFDVVFTKQNLHDGISKLIYCYETIMDEILIEIDFISANDDTHNEVSRYEKDVNDVKDFGLFVTNRTIPDLEPYYSSETCNAYVNLTHVSFGVYY